MRRPNPTARPGFTLVELMVAMALSILIMAILAGAFQVGLDTMSQLKSLAGLSEQLRAAETVLLRDLSANHMEDEWARPIRVSDPRVQKEAWLYTTQKRGFFKVRQVSTLKQDYNSALVNPPFADPTNFPNGYPFILEGTDPDGVQSFRATDQVLHMTSKLSGANADQVYIGLAPPALAQDGGMNRKDLAVGNQLVSPWAEILYFLKPSGQFTTGDESVGGKTLTLYTLYRRQRVLTPGPFGFSPPMDQNQYPGISVQPSVGTQTNDPLTITDFNRRLNPNFPPSTLAIAPSSPEYGSDVLLSGVVSFQIRLQFEGQATFADDWQAPPLVPGQMARTDPPNTPGAPRVYDTADAPALYPPYAAAGLPPTGVKPRVRAIQIKLRIYDTNNKLTRQVTITQDL